MKTRPRIQLTLSLLDRRLEKASTLVLIFLWSLTFYSLYKLPAIIPLHFNAVGKPDRYGNKENLIFLALIGTAINFGIKELNKYPQTFNYWTKVTEENAQQLYTLATRTLRLFKLSQLIIFSLLQVFVFLTSIGVTNGLGVWFTPLALGIIVIPIIFTFGQFLLKQNKGNGEDNKLDK